MLYQETERHKLHFNIYFVIILISFEFLKSVLINMVAILMLSPNWLLGLLKINLFQKKGYDVIIFVHDVINKVLSRDSNYITDVAM